MERRSRPDNNFFDRLPQRIVLAAVPVLVLATDARQAAGLGLAALTILGIAVLASGLAFRLIPQQVRLLTYSIITATLTSITRMLLLVYLPVWSENLNGLFPLVLVSCLLLSPVELFDGTAVPADSWRRTLTGGVGFALILTGIGLVREVLSAGTWFGHQIMAGGLLSLRPAAFILTGLLLFLLSWAAAKLKGKGAGKHGRS